MLKYKYYLLKSQVVVVISPKLTPPVLVEHHISGGVPVLG
jgi:hypothetical protein